MNQRPERLLLALGGFGAREMELHALTLPMRIATDGAESVELASAVGADVERPWTVLAVRCDAGPGSGFVDGLTLETIQGRADIFAGALPVGVWVPQLVELPHQWAGGVFGALVSAELANVVPVSEAVVLGGTLAATAVGDPFADGGGFQPSLDDYLAPLLYPEGEQETRTIAILTTCTHSSGSAYLLGRGAGAGLMLYVTSGSGLQACYHANAAGSYIAGTIAGTWPSGARRWTFITYSKTAAEDWRWTQHTAGDPTALLDVSDDYSAAETGAVAQRIGRHSSGNPWSDVIEEVAIFDGTLTAVQKGAIASTGSAKLSGGGVLLGSSTGAQAARATGGSVTLLLGRRRV